MPTLALKTLLNLWVINEAGAKTTSPTPKSKQIFEEIKDEVWLNPT